MKAFSYFFVTAVVFTILLICICCCIWLAIVVTASGPTGQESNGFYFSELVLEDEEDTFDEIVIIDVNGLIFDGDLGFFGGATADTSRTIAQLDLALENENVKGVLLRVDSPGGEVIASDDLYRKITEVSQEKPVVVYSEGLLASGAYYIAMGADYIVVNEFNLSGSIGVFIEFYNYDGLYEKLGIDIKRITNSNGTYKLNEQIFDDTPDEVDQNIVKSLDVVYDRFVNIIVEERGLSEIALRDSLAKGQVYDAYTALDNNLVDEIGTESDAFEKLLDLAGLEKADQVQYQEQFGFFEIFTGPAIKIKNTFSSHNESRIYYM